MVSAKNTRLSVNLNKIALLRNARGRDYPSVEYFATLAIKAGAGGITLHPRPDQRHARYDDVFHCKSLVDKYSNIELNIEGNPQATFLDVVLEQQPHQCTLVPDADNQITSDHGWPLLPFNTSLKDVISRLNEHDIRISLFVDPNPEVIAEAANYGCHNVELYTEAYAQAYQQMQDGIIYQKELDEVLKSYQKTAEIAQAEGLSINAGHDLNLDNLAYFLDNMPTIDEVSIGHALTVESLLYGFEETIQRYILITDKHRA